MRGLGFIPESREHVEADIRLRPVSELIGTSPPSSSWRDWRHLDPFVDDQHQTNMCLPFSIGMGVYMRGQAAVSLGEGAAVPRPSVMQPYIYGQLEAQRQGGVPRDERRIRDEGLQYRAVLAALEANGLIAAERWPFSPAELAQFVDAKSIKEISERIPFDIDLAGADARVSGWHRMGERPFSEECALALDKAHFPSVAIGVYQNFMTWSGSSTYDQPEGRHLGYHAMIAVAYQRGETCFKNSYGPGYADGGYIWLSNRFLDNGGAIDGLIVTAAPPLR